MEREEESWKGIHRWEKLLIKKEKEIAIKIFPYQKKIKIKYGLLFFFFLFIYGLHDLLTIPDFLFL
jgi:hypothetical protein